MTVGIIGSTSNVCTTTFALTVPMAEAETPAEELADGPLAMRGEELRQAMTAEAAPH
jgi:hypothetical protein